MSATDAPLVRPAPEDAPKSRIGPVEAAPPPPDEEMPPSLRVEDIAVGRTNACGEVVRCIYYKTRDYAVYATDERVRVQFSDDPETAHRQFAALAPLFPLRQELRYLSRAACEDADARCDVGDYRFQIAEAFRIGLQSGEPQQAERILRAALGDAGDRILRRGRLAYLFAAGACAFVLAAVFFAAAYSAQQMAYFDHGFITLMRACGSGAIGALLSIAIAIRERAVAPERDLRSNVADASVRIVIGVLSGGGIYLFVASGLVGVDLFDAIPADPPASGAGGMRWQTAVTLGFVAGFLERLVPDLLARTPSDRPAARARP